MELWSKLTKIRWIMKLCIHRRSFIHNSEWKCMHLWYCCNIDSILIQYWFNSICFIRNQVQDWISVQFNSIGFPGMNTDWKYIQFISNSSSIQFIFQFSFTSLFIIILKPSLSSGGSRAGYTSSSRAGTRRPWRRSARSHWLLRQ